MMHALGLFFTITGILFWVIVAFMCLRSLPYALVCACSLLKCQLRAMRLGHRSPRWHRLPQTFLGEVWRFWGSTPGGITVKGSNYHWAGPGDWWARAVLEPELPTEAKIASQIKS